MGFSETINEIRNISTYMDDESDDACIRFVTRENGDVCEEEYGMDDFKEATRVRDVINKDFPDLGLDIEIDCTDEWVYLEIWL